MLANENGCLDRILKLSAFYSLAYENLKFQFVGRFEDFFEACDVSKAAITGFEELRAEFRTRVKGRSKFEAARDWFVEVGAVSEEEAKWTIEFIGHRNEVIHGLGSILWDPRKNELDELIVAYALTIAHQLSNWWLRNYELPILGDEVGDLSDADLDAAASADISYLIACFHAAFPDFKERMEATSECGPSE